MTKHVDAMRQVIAVVRLEPARAWHSVAIRGHQWPARAWHVEGRERCFYSSLLKDESDHLNAISMQSACNQHAISMQSACNQRSSKTNRTT